MLSGKRTLFGGPSQPEPLDERGGIQQVRNLAQQDEQYLNANQYENNGVSSYIVVMVVSRLTPPELASARAMDGPPDRQAATRYQCSLRRAGYIGNNDRYWDVLQDR